MRFGCRWLAVRLACVLVSFGAAAAPPTWSPPQLLATTQFDFLARPAFDGQGGAYVLTGGSDGYRVHYAASGSDAWQTLPPLAAPYSGTTHAKLVADAAGALTVVYRFSQTGVDELRAERYTPGIGWGAPRTLHSASTTFINGLGVIVDALSNVVACTHEPELPSLAPTYSRCTVYDAASDTWSVPQIVATDLLQYPALVRSPNGMSVVLTGIFGGSPRLLQVWRYDVASRSWSGTPESVTGTQTLSNVNGTHDFVAAVDDGGAVDLVALRLIGHSKSSFAGLRGEGGRWRQTTLLDWRSPPYAFGPLIDASGAVDGQGRIIVARKVSGVSSDADGVVFIGGPRNAWRVDKLFMQGPPDSGVYGSTAATWAGSNGEAVAAFAQASAGFTPYFFDGQSWAAAPLPGAAPANAAPVLGTAPATGKVLLLYLNDGDALYATWLQR